MKNRLLFLGPPGAGKGTQASLLSEKKDLLHMSTGDLLRMEVAAGSPLGLKAAEIMNKGELVSDSIVLSIVEENIKSASKGWLLDGFPRNVFQAKALEKLLLDINQPLQLVILIDVADQTLLERLLSRGRADDTEDVVRHRLDIYREKTSPLVEFYKNQGLLKVVRGDRPVADISFEIQKIIS